MMLFDGALRFCEQARAALAEKNFEQSYNLISRVQRILLELNCSLKHDVQPELDAVIYRIGPAQAMAALFLIGRYVMHAYVVNALNLATPVPSIFAGDRK